MSKTLLVLCIAAGFIALPVKSTAGTAEICYSAIANVSNCNTPSGCYLPTNTTVFQCPTAGNKTIPQLASEGWVVTQLAQRTQSSTTQVEQIVIQKP